MASWAGGLPPIAAERVQRQRASGTAGSLLSVPDAAAVAAVGLVPVGEVFGCVVASFGWTGGYCGAATASWGPGGAGGSGSWGWGTTAGGARMATTPVVTSAAGSRWRDGFASYVRAFEGAWGGALNRMVAEARALGADGVVDVRDRRTRLEGRVEEFTATGTAVRVADPALRAALTAGSTGVWCAGLTGADCAAAIASGHAPRGMALGVSVSTKHEDWQVRQQETGWSNTEVTGLTELVQAARSDARHRLANHASRIGGSDLVITRLGLTTFETECGEVRDLHAQALFAGTVLADAPDARRGRGASRLDVLPVVPLGGSGARTRRRDPRHR